MTDRIMKAAGFSVLSVAGALALGAFASTASAASGTSSALSFSALNPFGILSQAQALGTTIAAAPVILPDPAVGVPQNDKPKKSKKADGDDDNQGGGNG